MARNIVYTVALSLLASGDLVLWYLGGLTGSGYAYTGMFVLLGTTVAALAVSAYRAARRRARGVAAALLSAMALLVVGCLASMAAGVDAYEAELTAQIDELRERVEQLDREVGANTRIEVTERFPEYGYASAERIQSGQLVIQLNSRWGRRGMVYVSNDDLDDARFPEWFGFKKLRPRWYMFLVSG